MQRVVIILLSLLLAACSATPTEEPLPTPIDLLTDAAVKIRATETFRMTVERTGTEYFINTDFGGAEFRRAEVQYAAPETIQARVRVIAAGLPLDLDFFFRATNQWLRGIWTNNAWVPIAFVPGFTPAALMAEESGFQAAINALTDLEMVGREQLIDGTPVYHLKAVAPGEAIQAFMAGLIEVTGRVRADVYIHRETGLPVRFVIIQPESVSDTEPDPTTWTIEVYDFDQPVRLDDPEATSDAGAVRQLPLPDTTSETTPEATPAS